MDIRPNDYALPPGAPVFRGTLVRDKSAFLCGLLRGNCSRARKILLRQNRRASQSFLHCLGYPNSEKMSAQPRPHHTPASHRNRDPLETPLIYFLLYASVKDMFKEMWNLVIFQNLLLQWFQGDTSKFHWYYTCSAI